MNVMPVAGVGKMKIDCVSDLHGYFPELPGGDMLILAGDFTAGHSMKEWNLFYDWLKDQSYDYKIMVAGNHDYNMVGYHSSTDMNGIDYLKDTAIELGGLKIWGSPYTATFPGINPMAAYFTESNDRMLSNHWKLIPDDTDIVITHMPPYGLHDRLAHNGENVGSKSLFERLGEVKPKLNVCGHIHEGYGYGLIKHVGKDTICVNASLMNEHYEPVNKPIRIEL